MGPIRGNNKNKRKAEEKSELLVSLKEGSTDWWDVLSKKIAGSPSPPQGLDTFKPTLGLSKKTFEYLCALARDHMTSKTHFVFKNGKPLTITDQVALALRRLKSGSSLISIGDSFNTHHSTVSQVTWRFVEAIEEKALHHLHWPASEEEMAHVKAEFQKIHGLPNCCGAIDTTHVTMQLTSSDQEAEPWLDRRGRSKHSMVLQAVVGPDLRFRDVVAGWPGKMSDASVLKSCSFYEQCQKREKLNGKKMSSGVIREYIVGDGGFPLLPWLVTPYKVGKVKKVLESSEVEFNERLVGTHSMARKAMAKLKEDWKMIKGEMWRPDRHKLPRIILVCCILHNVVIDVEKGDEGDEFDESFSTFEHDFGYEEEVCEFVDGEGLALRDELCKHFSAR